MKIRNVLVILSVLLLISLIINNVVDILRHKPIGKIDFWNLKGKDSLLAEYQVLFSEEASGQMSNKKTYFPSSEINPLGSFDFQNKYEVLIFKLKSSSDSLLKNSFKLSRKKISPSHDLYMGYKFGSLDFFYREVDSVSTPAIFLTIPSDESFRTVFTNDSIQCHYVTEGIFSITYGSDIAVSDIYTHFEEKLAGPEKVPIIVLFLQKKNAIYVLLITPKGETIQMPPLLLFDILK